MAANILSDDKDPQKDFDWLDDLYSDDCFMDHDASLPFKSLDFGRDGYTGSVTVWNEILQITAPDPRCGLIYVRGDFPDNADSVLARAQRHIERGTWGLRPVIDPNEGYSLEGPMPTGMINLRWPFSQFNLTRPGCEDGLYTTCSFVKDHTVYQIIRIVPGKETVANDRQGTTPLSGPAQASRHRIKFTLGGTIRFGCACSNAACSEPFERQSRFKDNYYVYPSQDKTALLCRSARHDRSLRMRLWVDRDPVELRRMDPVTENPGISDGPQKEEFKEQSVDMTAAYETTLVNETPKTLVATFSIIQHCGSPTDDPEVEKQNRTQLQERIDEPHIDSPPPIVIMSSEAQNYLGVADVSSEAPLRMWSKALGNPDAPYDTFEGYAVGRNVEQILGVTSIPIMLDAEQPQLQPPASDDQGPQPPPSDNQGPQPPPSDNQGPQPTPSDDQSTQPQAGSEPRKDEASPGSAVSQNFQNSSQTLDNSVGVIVAENAGEKLSEQNGINRSTTGDDMHIGIALIRNIITPQWVDLESTFWQVRLLVRAYAYFGPESPIPDLPEKDAVYGQPIAEMGRNYRVNLLNHIRAACIWLLKAKFDFHPGLLPSDIEGSPSRRDCFQYKFLSFADNDRIWYLSVTLWYVLHHCSDAFSNVFLKELLWSRLGAIEAFREMPPYQDDNRPRSCFLQWYSYYSFGEISKQLEKEDSARFGKLDFTLQKTMDQVRTWKVKSEKSIKPSGNARSAQVLLTDHHIMELALLGEEILISSDSKSTKCQHYASASLNNRQETRFLNPGRVERYQSINSAQLTTPPWELFCLNHHIKLRPEADAADSDVDSALSECREFLFADYTFMKSWDRSNVDVVGEWWDVITGSMIVTTLLDNRWRPQTSARIDGEASIPAPNPSADDIAEKILKALHSGFDKNTKVAVDQSDDPDAYDWMALKPQRTYFPDTSTQSLEDTPELFQSKQTRKLSIRSNIWKYLTRKNSNVPPDWSLQNIADNIRPEELLYISCFDLTLVRTESGPEVIIFSKEGRANEERDTISLPYAVDNQQRSYKLINEKPTSAEESNERGMKEEDRKPNLWLLYLHGRPELHPSFKNFPRPVKQGLTDPKPRNEVLSKYQSSLFRILHDSNVDLGTKNRIFFAQRFSPTVIQAFIYMWHTDALDTFDDHLGPVSRFFDSASSSSSADIWITSITISHWGLQHKNEGVPEVFEEDRGEKAGFPPQAVQGRRNFFPRLFWLAKPEYSPNAVEIGETSSSLVITGDENGVSWTCSIVSPLLDEFHVRSCAEDARRVMTMFLHQQASGRALVFILFLGHLCENLAREYEYFLYSLDNIMGMGQRVLLRGMEWEKSEVALRKLKKMLWCLEALRIFDDKLTSALAEIREARKQTQQEVDKGKSLRHRSLKRYAESTLEEFDKRYSRLEDAHSTILQRIEQSTNLREGITSVLGVEQNENIGMLTYITIAYLPLSFIAAIFSMTVTPSEWSGDTFGWLTVVFFIGTFAFALSLQTILGTVRKVIKIIDLHLSALEKKAARRTQSGKKTPKNAGVATNQPNLTSNSKNGAQKGTSRVPNLDLDLEQGESNGFLKERSADRVSLRSKAVSIP